MRKLCAALFLSLWLASAALAQQISGPIPTNALACVFNTAPPTLPTSVFGYVQCDTNGKLITSGGGSVAISSPLGGGTQAAAVRTTLATDSPGIILLGPAAVSGSVPFTLSSQYPTNATTTTPTAITASTTGTTGATTATLAGVASKTTFICGFTITSDATAAIAGAATVTGTITGTLNYIQNVGSATSAGQLQQTFSPCIPASATNTGIAVNSVAAGTGGNTAVTAWGYQL